MYLAFARYEIFRRRTRKREKKTINVLTVYYTTIDEVVFNERYDIFNREKIGKVIGEEVFEWEETE